MIWAILSFFCMVIFLPIIRRKAIEVNFVDQPNGRKHHSKPVPAVGGLALIPVFLALSYFSGVGLSDHIFFIVALIMVWILGTIDDAVHVKPLFKFIFHFLAAALLVIGNGTIIYSLGDLFGFGEILLGPFGIIFSVLCVVFMINAINMIDGLDGLCAGIILIILSTLGAATYFSGGYDLSPVLLILIGALLGFMVFNYRHMFRQKASLFMGDSGSTALGLIISWLVIELTQGANHGSFNLNPALIAWVLAVPVFDALGLFMLRLTQKRSPFSADRQHLHYLICDNGAGVERSVQIMHVMTLFYCLIGMISFSIFKIPALFLMPVWIMLACLHFAVTFGLFQKLLRKVCGSY